MIIISTLIFICCFYFDFISTAFCYEYFLTFIKKPLIILTETAPIFVPFKNNKVFS